MEAIAVDGSLTSNDEAVNAIGIYQGSEIFACLPLYACLAYLEVGYAL